MYPEIVNTKHYNPALFRFGMDSPNPALYAPVRSLQSHLFRFGHRRVNKWWTIKYLQVWDEYSAGDGRAECPDCHEVPERQDGQQRVVAKPAVSAA